MIKESKFVKFEDMVQDAIEVIKKDKDFVLIARTSDGFLNIYSASNLQTIDVVNLIEEQQEIITDEILENGEFRWDETTDENIKSALDISE